MYLGLWLGTSSALIQSDPAENSLVVDHHLVHNRIGLITQLFSALIENNINGMTVHEHLWKKSQSYAFTVNTNLVGCQYC
jgi:calcineurin-like phosphoesterase